MQQKNIFCLLVLGGGLVGLGPWASLWGVARLVLWLHPLPQYTHCPVQGGDPVTCTKENVKNWAENVNLDHVTVFYPTSVEELQNIIKMAKKEGSTVRAVGARGTWNSWLWTDSPSYLISLVPRSVADRWYMLREEARDWLNKPGPMAAIQGVQRTWEEQGRQLAVVRVGAGTLVHQLIRWGQHTGYQLPSNVLIERATVGGVVAVMAHGAGHARPTVADYVLAVEFVDVNGVVRVVQDKPDVETWVASFGLAGVAVFFELRMEKVRHTTWQQPERRTMHQILPRLGHKVNKEMDQLLTSSDYQQISFIRTRSLTFLQAWTAQDLDLASDETSSVGQLFTEQSEVDLALLLTLSTAIQDFCLYLSQKLNFLRTPLSLMPWIIDAIGDLTKRYNKQDKKIVTTLEATHPFRSTSIKIFRVFEFDFPIWKIGGALNWSTVQAAVWDVIDVADKFRSEGTEALDDHLDIRLMSSSTNPLSYIYSNSTSSSTPVWGWAGIAVASSPWVDQQLWQRFMFEVVSLWSKYSSPEGTRILPRPHWAKEMPQFVAQEELYVYLRRAYQNELTQLEPRLNKLLRNISKTNLSEAFNTFGTQHHHKLFKHFQR